MQKPETKHSTVLKMDDFKKSPCGHISLCPCQTLRSNDIRISFGLIKMVSSCPQMSVKVLGFSDVCKTANFQAIELIFCMKRYFLILLPVYYTHFMIFGKKCLAGISFERPKHQNPWKMANFQVRELIFCMKRYFLILLPVCYTRFMIVWKKLFGRYIIWKAKTSKSAAKKLQEFASLGLCVYCK